MVTIEHNIEQKPGYKHTEIGWLPEDWEVKHLDEIAEVVMGQSPVGTSYNQNGNGFPLINGPTEFTDKYPIKIQWTSQPTKFCQKNDILLCVRGSSTGRINIANDEYCIGRGVAAIRARTETDIQYIKYQVDCVITNILALTTGSTFPNIDGKSIRSIKFAFPPLPEQQAIAAALGDVDALIASLDALIAKKRDIKAATMQQLLTGKTRLPGFSGAWEVKKFGEIFQFLSTANNARSDLSMYGDIKYIHYGDIHVKWRSFLDCASEEIPSIQKDKVGNVPFLEDGDLIMVDASEDYEGIGISVEVKNITDKKIVAGLHTFLLRGNKEIVADGFKGYLQYFPTVSSALRKAATGISVYGISKNNIKDILISLPPLPEQQAIATILSDMDAEIALVEQRRDKTRALKQAMMQELLTGKTRLR